MKLLILSTEFPPGPGGIGTHAYQLACHLTEMGWDVRVLASQDYVSDAETAHFNSQQPFSVVRFRTLRGDPVKAFYRWLLTWRQLRDHRPDLLLASGDRAVWIAATFSKWVRVVAIGHGTEFGISGWSGVVTRWAFQRVDAVICVSNYTAQYMRRRGITPRQCVVIPNGADTTRFLVLPVEETRAFRKHEEFAEVDRLLLTVGNVTERKGQDIVIRAMPRILERVPNAHYLIVGLPTRKAEFERLARDLGVDAHVHFLGRLDADTIPVAMNACDVFVMTSRHTSSGDFEGYGIAVVEAALCGKPAVVAGNSGLAEAVLDRETGLVVPQNDPDATAQAIVTLLADDQQRTRLGSGARQRAEAEQGWAVRVQEYDRVLRKLVGP